MGEIQPPVLYVDAAPLLRGVLAHGMPVDRDHAAADAELFDGMTVLVVEQTR